MSEGAPGYQMLICLFFADFMGWHCPPLATDVPSRLSCCAIARGHAPRLSVRTLALSTRDDRPHWRTTVWLGAGLRGSMSLARVASSIICALVRVEAVANLRYHVAQDPNSEMPADAAQARRARLLTRQKLPRGWMEANPRVAISSSDRKPEILRPLKLRAVLCGHAPGNPEWFSDFLVLRPEKLSYYRWLMSSGSG